MELNFAHLHLLLNHFPVIGSILGIALFFASFFGKNEDLRRSSLIIFAFVALLTIPTFLSGFGAELSIQGKTGVSDALMTRHEGSAMLSLWFMLATGVFSLVGLWQARYKGRSPGWSIAAIFLLSLLTVATMARTGNTGGDIRHPEVSANTNGTMTEGTAGSIFAHFEPNPDKFSQLMLVNEWWWGFLMGLHFMGLALIVGTVGVLDLRVMGFLKQLPIAPLQRFIPWALLGLGVNILTGMLAFIGQPEMYIYSGVFWLKMFALVLLGINGAVFYLTGISEGLDSVGPGEDAPALAKLVASTALVLCFALIFFGRYIQPLGETIKHASN